MLTVPLVRACPSTRYICEQCLPRPFNAARARRIQLQKLPTLIKDDHGASVASSDDEDRGSNDDFSKNVFEEGLLDLLEQVSPEVSTASTHGRAACTC